VRFAPVVEGKAQDGLLEVMTDDTARPMATVTLTGNGKLRKVDLAPGNIDVGDTFAGISTTLSIARPGELLTVVNQEEVTFTIASISIVGDDADAFRLVDVSGRGFSNVALGAGAHEDFDIVFSPSHVGEFRATVSVLLDEDMTPQRPVPIRGRAIYVGAHGSGGCSTGGDAGGATVLVLGLVLVLRRRRW
jgi:MYXO-CTERM domain-containing protein